MRARLLCAVCLWLCAAAAPAAEYDFSFAPDDAAFEFGRGDNLSAFDRMLQLLTDFHGAQSLRFVLVGDDPERCSATGRCRTRELVKKRVQAITAQIGTRPDDARLATALHWRTDESAGGGGADTLRLRIMSLEPRVFSPQCPYFLEIADPRLPKTAGQEGERTWINVSGLTQIPVTANATIRIRLPEGGGARFSVQQKGARNPPLVASGAAEGQWRADQLRWSGGSVDLEIIQGPGGPRRRDVGEVSESWSSLPSGRPPGGKPGVSEVRFLLRK